MLCSIFLRCFCLSFELHFLIHLAPLMHHLSPLFVSSFLSLIPFDYFVYSWQKGGEYIGEYTSLYRHFYMTHVHTLRGSNSTSCTFLRGESYRGDAYTKGEKTFSLFLFWFILYLCPSRIVPRCIYFMYFALVVWLDMQVIISDCFVVHVWMNIYLLYVHWSHSLMTTLVWSSVCLHDIYCLHTWSHYACSCSYLVFNLS